ncbi:MAG: large-conductance mechanosensitive channel protein MscL [Oscillospiraceae bacterium]|nr:large-conductance mechanosensitive channel protein MscL [Oscillospiraceae bacterium]
MSKKPRNKVKKPRFQRSQKPTLPGNVLKTGKKAGRHASRVVGEFKEFISRGNVTDMAVGIIVGTSFTAIVNSLVGDVITPLVGIVLGGIDVSTRSVTLQSPFFEDLSVTVAYGKFLQSVISFFIIAVCVFFMVKTLNAIRRRVTPEQDSQEEKPDPADIALLTEIRDLLKQQNEIAESRKTPNQGRDRSRKR